MKKIAVSIVLFIGIFNYGFSQKLDLLFIDNFPCNKIEGANKEGLWIEFDTSSTNVYNFGYYNNNNKIGYWFSFNKELQPSQSYYLAEGDTLLFYDYLNKNEYMRVDTGKVYEIDFTMRKRLFKYTKNESLYPLYFSSSINGFSSKYYEEKECIQFHVFYNELSYIFKTNKNDKLQGKVMFFN